VADTLVQVELFAVVLYFSTCSADDILLLLTFICSLVSNEQDISQEELEELKVLKSLSLKMTVSWQ